MCAGNTPQPGIPFTRLCEDYGHRLQSQLRNNRLVYERQMAMLSTMDPGEPSSILHSIRSTLSRVLGAVKSFLDPSQFD